MPTTFKCFAIFCLAITSVTRADDTSSDPWQRLHQQLSIVTSLHLHEVPLNEAIETLGQQIGVQFAIDQNALDDLGLNPDEPVSVSAEGISLQTLLELMLRPASLTWTTRGGVIVITSEEEALTQMFVRVYAVPDLLGTPDEQAERGADFDSLIDLIISVIDSDSWVENGGPEAEIRPLAAANSIVIAQTIESHLKIDRLLADLRHVRDQQGLPVVNYTRPRSPTATRTPLRKTYVQPSAATPLPRSYAE